MERVIRLIDKLWYNTPEKNWIEGLPIGNGRIAAMVVNDYDTDCIQLNHEWLWRGTNKNRDNEVVHHHLAPVREVLLSGDFLKGTKLANDYFSGGNTPQSKKKNRIDPYQPAGDLTFKLENVKTFEERGLDLNTAINYATRVCDTLVSSQSYISCVDHFGVFSWTCESKSFDGQLTYSRIDDDNATYATTYTDKTIEFNCAFEGGISYQVMINYFTDGKTSIDHNVTIKNATYLHCCLNIAVCKDETTDELHQYPLITDCSRIESLKKSHIKKFSSVKNAMQLSIELEENNLPTNERIEHVRNGKKDDELMLLYFNYGKYLLMCSSICAQLPANLQGKWNDSLTPPWEADYHFDVNLQMNYWAAEQINMGECVEALLQYVESFIPHAKKAAKDLYGCNGIYLPIQTDAWGKSTPESYGWGAWIGAAPWIAQNFWTHYLYSMDQDFLAKRAYPFFVSIVEFYEDYLIKDADGIYQIVPSQSPENRFEGTGSMPVSIGISSAMDVQLCYDSLFYAIESATILGCDKDKIQQWQQLQNNLPEFKIGRDGRLLEWEKERVEVEPSHRHFSHLYGLYPSDIFTKEKYNLQYKACIQSLEHRLSSGGGHTGWSRAWTSCLFARIQNSELFYEHFKHLITDFTTTSLLDLHPPKIFQIDGNLGGVASVTEALMGCYNNKVHLLQALPKEWTKAGTVTNAKIIGGHLLSFKWKDNQVSDIHVELKTDYPVTICYNGIEKTYQLPV